MSWKFRCDFIWQADGKGDPNNTPTMPMKWDEVCHYIAQGAINIAEGHTTIEADSRVHRAMSAFCEYLSAENLTTKAVQS